MKIIERIEIKHFRSFDGGVGQEKVHISNLQDMNVFSGSNDSGKSNILRALNLFFNNEIAPGIKFNKDRDFSKIVANRFDEDIERRRGEEQDKRRNVTNLKEHFDLKDLRRSDEVISIKLHFNNSERQRGLPEKFWISKSFSKKNNFEGEYIYQTSLKGNAQTTLFIKNFQFEYIPAIKDREFFSYLFKRLQSYLFEKEDKRKENKFKQSSDGFNNILKEETEALFRKFLDSSGVSASFHIPSTLIDFFRTLSVRTENDISLFERGDGIQARFIPEILDEISKNSSKNIIWGFEEPENSYEAGNIRKLRDEFLQKYSKKKQIFITTHTKEFLSLKKEPTDAEKKILNKKTSNKAKTKALNKLRSSQTSSNVAIYRVWKNETTNNTSLVARFDEDNNEWDKTCDDLGIVQESRVIESLQEKLAEQTKKISESRLSEEKQREVSEELIADMQRCLENLRNVEDKIEEYEKPILYVEDKYDQIYKIAFLKVKEIDCNEDDFLEKFKTNAPFVIRRGESACSVAGVLAMNNTDGYDDKKVIGLFDFDKSGTEKFYLLKRQNNWDEEILGEVGKGIYKKRNQHPCFFALLLPIPSRLEDLVSDISSGTFESYVEIENLLPQAFLESNGNVEEKNVLDRKYLKFKGEKSNFWKQLFSLSKEDFQDFQPLFEKLEELFRGE